MQKNQSTNMSEMEQDEKRAYDALLELVDEAKRHLDNLKTDPDPKRPDIPPGIPQSILPVLRRIIQEAQVFKGLLRAPIKTKAARDKHIEEGKKRRREDPAEVQSGVARSQERQNMKDKLDELGTHLWNRTLLMNRVAKLAKEAATQVDNDYSRTQTRRDALAEWDKLFAYSRYAAYALIQVAGDDRKGIVRFIMRGLELATKTALALFASKEQEKSREVLTSAAELEDVLANKLQKGLDGLSDDRLLRQDCNRHIIDYYLARCSLEVDRDNETVAGTLMKKAIIQSNAMPEDIPFRSYQSIARKCHDIGCSLLSRIDRQMQKKKDGKDGELAVAAAQWFKSGVQLIDSVEGAGEISKSLVPFKSPLLEGLARASVLSVDQDPDALDRAQAITNDLLNSPDTMEDRTKMQAFLLINLHILRKRNAPGPEVIKILNKLIDLLDWEDEDGFDRVLAELDQSATDPKPVVAVYRYFLSAALKDAEDARRKLASRIFLALVLFLQKQQATFFTGPELQRALDAIKAVEGFHLDKPQALAAITMIWKSADKLSQSPGARSHAAEWFVAGAHPAFTGPLGTSSVDKWRRRAALCYLQVKDHAKSEAILWQCDPEDADTRYMQFVLALDMAQTEQACDRVKKLGEAPNCSKKHLILAIQNAADCDDQAVMKAAMRTMLSYKPRGTDDSSTDSITLVRALIRLCLKDVDAKSTPKETTVRAVLTLYHKAIEICRKLHEEGQMVVYFKDCAWLYKTAYNLGIQGMSSWENTDDILDCFAVAIDLMRLYQGLLGVATDPQLPQQMLMGLHACLCGSVFAARATEDDEKRAELWRRARDTVAEHQIAMSNCQPAQGEIRNQAFILKVEILGNLGEWNEIITLLESAQTQHLPLQVCEAIADLSFQHGVPVAVTYMLQKLALRIANTSDNTVTILRWLRSIIDLLIHRKDSGDLKHALEHIEKARNIAQNKMTEASKVRDSEELEWLLATTWNQGLDYIYLSDPGHAKAWLEQAISFCSLVPNGEVRLGQMRSVYNKVLAGK